MPSTRIESILKKGRKNTRLLDQQDIEEKLREIREEFQRSLVETAIPTPEVMNGRDGKDGLVGPQGPAGSHGKDGSGFNWLGNWKESHRYQPFDVVNYMGSTYVALEGSLGDYPNRINNAWDLMASAGAQGPSGRDAEDFNVVSEDSNYTVIDGVGLVLVDASVADVTVTLPSAGDRSGRIITVKKTDSSSNSVVLSPPTNIDGNDTASIIMQNVSLSAQSDGYNWWII